MRIRPHCPHNLDAVSDSRAFTLVELIVVVAIMGMGLSVFLGINYRQREAFRWRTNLRELHVFLKVARSYAVLERRTNICRFNPKKKQFSEALRGRQMTLTAQAELVLSAAQSTALAAAESKLEVAEDDETKPVPRIILFTFYADGGASGEPLLLKSGRRQAVLEVDSLTGGIKLTEQVADASTQ